MSSISPALNAATHGPHVPTRSVGHTPRPAAAQPPTAPATAAAPGKRVDISA